MAQPEVGMALLNSCKEAMEEETLAGSEEFERRAEEVGSCECFCDDCEWETCWLVGEGRRCCLFCRLL